ncbi:MAG: RDD family protein [Halioglobus sp.]|nr:RDD family protein [Halioglobus sp.]
MEEKTPLPPPSFGRHLIAMFYDLFLVVAVVAVVNALALALEARLGGDHLLAPLTVQLLSLGSTWGFFCLFWHSNGQTLGMQAWRIQLVNLDGGAPGWAAALKRCAGATLSLACFGSGYLWRFIDARNLYWHDHLSGTHLVQLPKQPAA